MSKLDELLAEQARLGTELDEAKKRYAAAAQAVLEERFTDVPRHAQDDVILVKRKLFGKEKWWLARVAAVHLRYLSGTDAAGKSWENKIVSYSVFLQQKDGSFGGSSEGYYHNDTAPLPAEVSGS